MLFNVKKIDQKAIIWLNATVSKLEIMKNIRNPKEGNFIVKKCSYCFRTFYAVKDTVNCTTFDTQKCTTLRSKMMLNLFRNQKPDHNVQSGYVLYSKNLTQKGL